MDRLKRVGYVLGFVLLAPFLFVGLAYIFGAEELEKRLIKRKLERARTDASMAPMDRA